MRNRKIVVLGGGHGQSALLRGIKHIENVDITAIVTVADDGGSTGRLRHYFDIPAVGDIRGVLLSLAESESLLSSLMDYRFTSENFEDKGKDVVGHNLGNLILLALMQTNGSLPESIKTLSKVLNVKGEILPSTSQVITLFAMMEDGTIVKGEANIPTMTNRIHRVFYEEEVHASEKAVQSIMEADLIIYGVGSIYTSILPNVIIPGINQALKKSKARHVYFCNAMTQPGETSFYQVEDHVEALLAHDAIIEDVVVAMDDIPLEIIQRYQKEGSTPVQLSRESHPYQIHPESLLSFEDGFIRHDADKIKEIVEKLLPEIEG